MRFGRALDHGDDIRLVDVTDIPEPLPEWAEDAAAYIAMMYPDVPGFGLVADDNIAGAVRQENGSYRNPDESVAIVPPQWNEYDFRDRFTRDERKAIMAAVKVDDDIADFEAMLQAAGRAGKMIVANDPLLVVAMQALVDGTLLTADRRNAILGTI